MRGRKPKPTAAQISAGDPRKIGRRKLEQKLDREPKAARGLPACPTHLKGRERAAWKFWSEELRAMGLDRRPDAQMLEGACVHYARAVEADLRVKQDGFMLEIFTVDAETKEKSLLKIQRHPAIEVSNAAWRQVKAFLSEFGLSPVARTRLAIEPKDDGGDDLIRTLMQPRAPKNPVTVQ